MRSSMSGILYRWIQIELPDLNFPSYSCRFKTSATYANMPGCFNIRRSASDAFQDKPAPARSAVMTEKHQHPTGQSCACSYPSAMPLNATSDSVQLPSYSAVYAGSDGLSTINASLDALSSDLAKVSAAMHDNPEIAWKEVKTAKLLSDFMEKQQGWKVRRSVYGTETGWEAVFVNGNGGKTIGVNSEMDALPGIGHACGHNLIASACAL